MITQIRLLLIIILFAAGQFTASPTRAHSVPPANCIVVTEIPLSECTALIDLYTQTDGPHWNDNSGWTTTRPCSTPWHGIICDAGHIMKIELSFNQLTGSLPATLNHLTRLQSFRLNRNMLSGSIPSLRGLTHLRYLSMFENHLSGSIPSLSDLIHLQDLDLADNALSGSIPPLSGLTDLQYLVLSSNALSGSIPDLRDVAQFYTQFHYLDLSHNDLSGSVPASITGTLITYLALCGGSNHLTSPDSATDAWIAARDKSWTPGVGCTPTTDTSTVAALSPDCSSVTEIPQSECSTLLDLYTRTNGPRWKTNSGWTTTTPCSTPWYGIKCAAGHVTQIKLAQNNLSGTLPTKLKLIYLQDLDLSENALSGSIPSLRDFASLQGLDLRHNALSGLIPSLSGLTNLLTLDLSDNALSGSIPSLNDLINLQHLSMYNNTLSGSIPSLSRLCTLQDLDLSENALSGSIPPLSSCTLLIQLGLSENHLSGPIPDLSNLTYLTYLYLSNNDLSGPIPDLSNLTNLKWLYLDHNQLSGFVPESITSTGIEIPFPAYNLTLCGGSNRLTPPDSDTDAWIAARDKSWTARVGCTPTTDMPTRAPLVTF